MRALNKSKLILTLVPAMILILFCQESSALHFRNKKLYKNPWSIQVAFDGTSEDDDEGEYQGIRISLKRHYSKYSAARFSLGFVGHEVHHTDYDRFQVDGVTFGFEDDSHFDVTGVNLAMHYLFYPTPDRKFQFFWGAGPRLSVNELRPDIVVVYYNDYFTDWYGDVDYDNSAKLGLGVEALIGAEWFLWKNFSLLAEYGVTVQNEWYLFDVDYYDRFGYAHSETESFNDGLHVDGSRMKLGFAFYF